MSKPISQEFTMLSQRTILSLRNQKDLYLSASRAANIKKNRYSNVLALEETRIKLQRGNMNGECSDYINANLVKFETRQYICCQAPLLNTIIDFWQMVWQENCPVIVMLNPEVENGKLKANAYWPLNDKNALQFGDILVVLESTIYLSGMDIYIRFIALKNVHTGEEKRVVHLHYLGWPDFGVPSSSLAMRKLIEIEQHFHHGEGPSVVHCSAGIGRTGTYLAIQMAMQHQNFHRIRQTTKMNPLNSDIYDIVSQLNVIDIVLSLRQQRNPGMVQTLVQYQFIYQALYDALMDDRDHQVIRQISTVNNLLHIDQTSRFMNSPQRFLSSSENFHLPQDVKQPC